MSVVGEHLAHYHLTEKIGEGGIGVVWKAVDTRLGRDVAIKMLSEELTSDEARVASIVREARTAASLNHPNILTVHSIEEDAGRRFIVMELVDGETLDNIVRDGGLELDRFFAIAIPLADAVAAAHDHGVIHGDLKPRNIMIGPDDHVTVLDFGLSRSCCLPAELETSADPTRSLPTLSRIAGTVQYMSPEQLKGATIDARSDLFSLGVVLYEMATGLRPFSGETAPAVIASLLRDEPRPLSEARRGLPRQLGRIIRNALDKDPGRRFHSAIDLRNDLQRLREELTRDASYGDIRTVAVLPLDDLSGDPEQAFFADGMTDALINTLGRISALKVISRTSVMRYRDVSRPLPEVARELGVDAVVEGSVLRAGNRVRITAQLIDAARDRLLWADCYEHDLDDVLSLQGRAARAIASRIAVELTPQEHAHLSSARRVDPGVYEAYLKGRHFWRKRTTSSVRQGLDYFERAVKLDPSYAPAHAGIADSYIVDGGRYLGVAPDVAYGRARAAAEKAMELDDSLAESHTSLAAVMTDYDWDWDGADREYRRAIELNPSYATAHSWYAEQLSRMARHDEAIAESRVARQLDPLSLTSSMIVAWILYFARRYDESIAQARQTLELDESFATAHRILGWAYEETGQHEAAIAAHRRASELTDRQPNFLGQLGRAYALNGNRDEANAVVEELLDAATKTYVSALDIAIIYTALGETDEALTWLERAFEE
ncbi:MAG: protein kinase, partial [Acidobacteriota bacterium]|nr:protein kinase [Acidobacteriota bacterium]